MLSFMQLNTLNMDLKLKLSWVSLGCDCEYRHDSVPSARINEHWTIYIHGRWHMISLSYVSRSHCLFVTRKSTALVIYNEVSFFFFFFLRVVEDWKKWGVETSPHGWSSHHVLFFKHLVVVQSSFSACLDFGYSKLTLTLALELLNPSSNALMSNETIFFVVIIIIVY